MRYRVSTKGSIIPPGGGDALKPGTIVEDGRFTADQIREHISSGYLVQLGMPSSEEKPVLRSDAPPLPMLDDEAKKRQGSADAIVVGAGSPPETKKTPSAETKPVEHASPWSMDPATLQTHTLDQLNAMISERDATIGRIETTGEAIQILSMDFKPGT